MFLTARLAAEHGIHASALRVKLQGMGFMDNSTTLTPAFTPNTVIMKSDGEEVGKLGEWLSDCAKAIKAPCDGTVEIGSLLADLKDQHGNDMCDRRDDGAGNGSMVGHGGSVPTIAGGMNASQSMPTHAAVAALADRKIPVGGIAAVAALVLAALLL